MKSIKILSLVLALVVGLSSCSLDTEMTGAALTQDQYDKLPGTAEGAVLGLYRERHERAFRDGLSAKDDSPSGMA